MGGMIAKTESFVARVDTGGRIRIAKDARVKLGIGDGDYVYCKLSVLKVPNSSPDTAGRNVRKL